MEEESKYRNEISVKSSGTELERIRGKYGRLRNTQKSVELSGERKKIYRTSRKEMGRSKLKVITGLGPHTSRKKILWMFTTEHNVFVCVRCPKAY
ncbi:hypothetical protein Trydic_g19170 [Trypoxylus dichotomus]